MYEVITVGDVPAVAAGHPAVITNSVSNNDTSTRAKTMVVVLRLWLGLGLQITSGMAYFNTHSRMI